MRILVARRCQLDKFPDLRVPRFQMRQLSSWEPLTAFRQEWNDLVERTDGDLFATYEWCSTWWTFYGDGRELLLILAFENDQLVGVVPLVRETLAWGPIRLRVIRLAGSDHVGTRGCLCVEPERLPHVLTHLKRRLAPKEFDCLHIGDLAGYTRNLPQIVAAFQTAFGEEQVFHADSHYPHSIFDLGDNFESYLAALSPSERSNIRKSQRRLADDCRLYFEPVDPHRQEDGFAEFKLQHERQWGKEGRLGYFRDWPRAEAFHRALSEKQHASGRLHFFRLRCGNETVGCHYAHAFGTRVHWFQASRDEDAKWDGLSPGRLLHCELVRQAIARGARQIDGLSGYYEFKRRLGARFLGLHSIYVFSPRFNARRRIRAFQTVTAAVAATYFRVWFWRAAPLVRLRMPHLSRLLGQNGLWTRFIRSRFILPLMKGSYWSAKYDINGIPRTMMQRTGVA